MAAIPQKRSQVQSSAPEAASGRPDPEPRWHDGAAPWSKLRNKKPGYHYVYVYKASQDTGPDYYEALGYEKCRYTDDGARPLISGNQTDGDVIEMRGHILMCCPPEVYKRIHDHGPDGDSGQRYYDQLEQKIVSKRAGRDYLRGIGVNSDVVRALNKTQDAEEED